MNSEIERMLTGASSVAYTEISNLAEDLTLPMEEYPLAQIIETLDDEVCPLCEWLHGKIIRRGTPEWEQYRLPSHINCRRTFAYIPADSEEEADFEPPPASLLQKHGHFHVDPLRYEELRVPAFADRRQFVFRRYADPEGGGVVSTLQWLVDPEGAYQWWRDNLSLRDLFRYAHIPQRLPKIVTPRSADELVEQFRVYQQYYGNIYASIRAELERLDSLAQSVEDLSKVAEYRARAGAIRRGLDLVVERELRDLRTLFRSPRRMRRLPPIRIVGMTDEQARMVEEAFREALHYLPAGHRMPPLQIESNLERDRSLYMFEKIVFANDFFQVRNLLQRAHLICHEYTHHLEYNTPELLAEAVRLYRQQTMLPDGRLEPLRPLEELYPGRGYWSDEMTRRDRFPDGYMGKWYEFQGRQYATEIYTQYYDYIFWKMDYVRRFRRMEADPGVGVTPAAESVERGHYLDQLFSPELLSFTRDLWRALFRR